MNNGCMLLKALVSWLNKTDVQSGSSIRVCPGFQRFRQMTFPVACKKEWFIMVRMQCGKNIGMIEKNIVKKE